MRSMDEDWSAHHARIRATTGGRPQQARTAWSVPRFSLGKHGGKVLALLSLVGFLWWPETEIRKSYPRTAIEAQNASMVGTPAVGDFSLVKGDPFPAAHLPYDLVVTIANRHYEATATVKGLYQIDPRLSAIRIITPVEINALDVVHKGQKAKSYAESMAPEALRGFVGAIGGMVDGQAEIRAQSDAQAAARNFIPYRLSDADVALFEAKEVRRIERSESGFDVIYVDGWSVDWSPIYWVFLAGFGIGLTSTVAQVDMTRSRRKAG